MRALASVPSGQPKLLLLWAFLGGFCQISWFDFCCTAFVPTKSISPGKFHRTSGFDRRTDSSLGDTKTEATTIGETETENEIGSDLEVVKFLTSSAIFHCGTEEGLAALGILNELCERRLPYDFDLVQDSDEASASASSANSDQGERVISRLSKFLPEKTTNAFLDSVRVMEEEGWMSTNPDSVDGLPSLHLNLVSNCQPLFSSPVDDDEDGDQVSFENQTHNLYELVRPFVYDTLLPEADRLLRSKSQSNNSRRKLRVSDVFLRRYGEDICGSVTRNGISIHYDVYSRITAVVALDEVASRGDNGLFTLQVDDDTGETSNHKALRRFFPLTTGDCVLHTWDVLHGVDVEAGLDRTSLIVWFDEEDESSATVKESESLKDNENELVSPWLSLEQQGSDSTRTTYSDGNDVRQFVLASALASASSSELEETSMTSLYLTSASKGNTFALTRMGSICEEGTIGDLEKEAFDVLNQLRAFDELPEILRDMLIRLRESESDRDAAERTELACRFWLEASLTGNPLAQKSLADEVMLEASTSGNPDERLLAATLFALASQQDTEEGPSDSLARVIEYDVAAREVQSQEEFLASPVVQTASAALGGL